MVYFCHLFGFVCAYLFPQDVFQNYKPLENTIFHGNVSRSFLTFGQKIGQVLKKEKGSLIMSKNRRQRDTQKEASMDKCINFSEFMRYLFDDEKEVAEGAIAATE